MPWKAKWTAQEGFTLVEVLVSISIFALAVLVSVGSIFVGHAISLEQVENAEKVQQLRSAIKLMADDLAFAQWDTSCSTPVDAPTASSAIMRVAGYVVPDAPGPDQWPAAWSQLNWNRVCVYYAIEGDTLIRETYRSANRYSRRIVLTGLGAGSALSVNTAANSNRLISVTLLLEKENKPGEYVEVSTQFFVP